MPTSGFKVEKVTWLVHSDPWQGTQPAMITRTPLCLCRDKDVLVHFLYWVDTALVKLDLIYHHLHKFREIVMKTWILWWNIQQNPHFFQASGYVINGFKSQKSPLLWNSNSKRPFFIKGKKIHFFLRFSSSVISNTFGSTTKWKSFWKLSSLMWHICKAGNMLWQVRRYLRAKRKVMITWPAHRQAMLH